MGIRTHSAAVDRSRFSKQTLNWMKLVGVICFWFTSRSITEKNLFYSVYSPCLRIYSNTRGCTIFSSREGQSWDLIASLTRLLLTAPKDGTDTSRAPCTLLIRSWSCTGMQFCCVFASSSIRFSTKNLPSKSSITRWLSFHFPAVRSIKASAPKQNVYSFCKLLLLFLKHCSYSCRYSRSAAVPTETLDFSSSDVLEAISFKSQFELYHLNSIGQCSVTSKWLPNLHSLHFSTPRKVLVVCYRSMWNSFEGETTHGHAVFVRCQSHSFWLTNMNQNVIWE